VLTENSKIYYQSDRCDFVYNFFLYLTSLPIKCGTVHSCRYSPIFKYKSPLLLHGRLCVGSIGGLWICERIVLTRLDKVIHVASVLSTEFNPFPSMNEIFYINTGHL